MKLVLTLLLAGPMLAGYAQKMAKPDVYAKMIKADSLKELLYTMASPEMEGRETGTEGQRKAAAYIAGYFQHLGLQPGNGKDYQMLYPLYQDSLTSASVEVNNKSFEIEKDFSVNNNAIQTTMRISEVIVVGGGGIDSVKSMELAGKAIMVIGSTNQILNALIKKGPAAILIVENNFPRTLTPNRRSYQTIYGFKKTILPPQFQVSEAVATAIAANDYESIKTKSKTISVVKTELLLEVKRGNLINYASNVIAILPGTDLKDEYVVISAHYDHLGKRNGVLYPGADDDGSGTVSVMQLAKAFATAGKEGNGPRRSIIFLENSGEEKGLWGSAYYTDHPIYPLDKTTVNLNIDMIGRSDPDRKGDTLNYIYVVGDDKISTDLKTISEEQNKKYTKLQLDYKYNDPNDKQRIYYRSDHYNFARYGVPIIFYYDGMLRPDYHKPTDTPDKINYTLMQKRAQLIFYTAWEMANRNSMLRRNIPTANVAL